MGKRVVIDVSGAQGKQGRMGAAGRRGYDGQHTGARGDDGTAGHRGKNGSNGSDAGNIDISLTANSSNVFIQSSQETLEKTNIALDEIDSIDLEASGGNGGAGGVGGRGGDGGRGEKGRNATEYHTGGPGGNGGNGGDGGRGGKGGNGGDGGSVTIRVKKEDTDLLMLCNVNIDAGKKGPAGRGGYGGDGGDAGPGGNSYHYTTSYVSMVGKTPVWYYVPHTVSGGYSGRRGNSGNIGPAGNYGEDGQEGTLQIEVTDYNQKEYYEAPYDIKIINASLSLADDKQFIEPGVLLELRPTFKNIGKMPSPTHQKMFLSLFNNKHVFGKQEVIIDHSIQAGEVYTPKIPLFVQIKEDYPRSAEPIDYLTNLTFKLTVEHVNQYFKDLGLNHQPIRIRSPITISQINQDKVYTEKTEAKYHYQLTNLSPYTFNQDNERRLRMEIKAINGDSPVIDQQITTIAGTQGMALKGTIPFPENETTKIFDRVAYETRLFLETVNGNEICVQNIPFSIQKSESFDANDANVVLISNASNTEEEISCWKEIFKRLHLSHAVWNMSLYHSFNIYQYLTEQGKSLPENCIFVFLNNHYITQNNQQVKNTAFADKARLFEKMKALGVKVYSVGEPIAMYETLSQLYSEERTVSRSELKRQVTPELAQCLSVPVKSWSFRCSQPSEETLSTARNDLRNKLSKAYPGMRFNFATEFQPTHIKNRMLFKKTQLGNVRVSPSLNLNDMWMSQLLFDSDNLETRHDMFTSQMDLHCFQLIKLLPFELKLEGLQRTIEDDPDEVKDLYYQAILSDLIQEQYLLRRHHWRGDYPEQQLQEKLIKLRLFCSFCPDNPLEKEQIKKILLTTEGFGRKHTHFRDHLLPHRRQTDMNHVTEMLVRDWRKLAGVKKQELERERGQIKTSMEKTSKSQLRLRFFEPYAEAMRDEQNDAQLIHDSIPFEQLQ